MELITIDGFPLQITNPKKILWPEIGIRKIDYISLLLKLAPFILPHTKDRLLTTIRYPDGINGKSFYQKSIPTYAPEWIERRTWNGIDYILINNRATLIWLGNQAALELHTAFNLYQQPENPTSLVFDLDPSEGQPFEQVVQSAIYINETLTSLHIKSWIKTSGATGLQIYIPVGGRYNYQTARKLNKFFAEYFSQKHPELITIERMVNKRENKLYFDYLQMWSGKTITSCYSPRATKQATVSMPIEWEEVQKGITPQDFNLENMLTRLQKNGDLFKGLYLEKNIQNLDFLLKEINSKKI